MTVTINGTTGITSPGGDTSTSLTTGTLTATAISTTGTINTANTFGFKNRIINGGMTIDQRNSGSSTTPTSSAYTLDRWVANMSVASKYSVQQNAGSVTPPVGFINYLGTTSLAATTVGSTDYYFVSQLIEGYNVSDLGWGTANAKTVTLSFWVRSSLTGTFGGSVNNSTGSRSYPFSYTISAANTWEQKSITIAGDTTGTWATTTGAGAAVCFGIGVGSTYSGTAGTWAGTVYRSATGATNVVSTNGATFYVTGVQFETGSQATSFDFRDFGIELAMCQRYYINGLLFNGSAEGGTTTFLLNATFPVQMRVIPTMSLSGPIVIYDGNGNNTQSVAAVGSVAGSTKGVMIFSIPNFSGLTSYRPGNMNPVSGTGTYAASAEF